MTLRYADRVQETTNTIGTGAYALGGAQTSYQAFSAACANGDTAFYSVTDGVNWEVGLGTYATSSNTLARTAIYSSSNSGGAVNWPVGNKIIFLDVPARYWNTTPVDITRTAHVTGDVTLGISDSVVYINKDADEATNVLLPAEPIAGQKYIVKDSKGDAGMFNATLIPDSGTIDGSSQYVIDVNYGAVTIEYNGAEWSVLA